MDFLIGRLVLALAMVAVLVSADDDVDAGPVYIVRMKGHPIAAMIDKPVYAINEEDDHETRDFVEMHTASLRRNHDAFLESLLEEGSYEKLYSYTYLMNGFAVKLRDEVHVDSIRAHPDVLSLEHEVHFRKTTTYTPFFLGLDPRAWKNVGTFAKAGEDIVIGVLDTGIDPRHPSFANTTSRPYSFNRHWEKVCAASPTFPKGSCNGKIIGARHFSKGIVAANAFNASNDYDSPLDGDGHGSHTSSVCAGNNGVYVSVDKYIYGRASGMAPRARIAVYKVIYRDGGYLSDVLAGIDQAVQDGVHVLSISLGATSGAYGVPFLNSFDIMMLLAFKANVFIVHAAGNNGPAAFSMNSFGPWVLSVAAGMTDRTYSTPIILGNGQWVYGTGLTAGTSARKLYPLIYSQDAYIAGVTSFDQEFYSYCSDPSPFNKTLVSGKILICNFVDYFSGGAVTQIEGALATAIATGAAGLLIVFPTSAEKTPTKDTVFDPIPFTIPASFVVDPNASALILQHYNEKTVKDSKGQVLRFDAQARIEDSRHPLYPLEAPRVASYSSRGPVYADTVTSLVADVMKPDVLAPGNQIWGAWTPKGTDANSFTGRNFAMLSGTSMATPHVAGIAALLIQKYPRWRASTIRSAIMTTADNFDNRDRWTRAEQPYSNSSQAIGRACPFDIGSGAINATAALDPGLVFDVGFQDYVDFLCEIPGADQNSVEYSTGAHCGPENKNPSDLNMPYITVANLIGSRVVQRTVVNLGGEETYNVTVRHPAGVDVSVKPRVFKARTGKPVVINVTLTATQTNQQFTFGYMIWDGDKGHSVRVPLVVSANSMSG
ncbi:subtilisin-like protease SBT2.5 [Selaginella moellendorffii]|uniref:subtilisin-like protease SBT2.5 n=1 Tax=Selaginella moellendorffii TaxID=88036 RepID=UPI000D1D0FF1|nr:subtilisin-like protease SBT2.5 [Selaginella moellendorffii]XP_024536901.1 subtilisin-like protease SBT2.5 [Selaginella moellendorffii]|eukprot:XP_024526147.1 subtilisin-like protease SBT2.5 [Selaginella moellendorffii]